MKVESKNLILILLGWFFFALGFIGVFLPVMPTTPFMIVAAACFSKGSPRLHAWLLRQKYIGASIKLWEDHRIIPRKAKVMSTLLILCGLVFPLTILKLPLWGILALIITLFSIIAWVWMQRDETFLKQMHISPTTSSKDSSLNSETTSESVDENE